MTENNEIQKRQNSYTGTGLVFGVSFGALYGILFLNGNVGTGAGIGLALGLVIGSIADSLGRPPVFTLLGTGLGISLGAVTQGLLMDGTMSLGAAFGAALGLVAGTLIDLYRGGQAGEGSPQGESNALALPSTHSLAVVSLVLGVLGLIAILPLVGAIGAVISGNMARRDIAQQPEIYKGDGLAKAGVILGWIGIVVGVLICLSLIFGLLLFNFATVHYP